MHRARPADKKNKMIIALHVVFFCIVAVALSLGNTVGYHRLLTHRAFKAHPAVRATLTVLSAMHSGSPALWVGVHRVHHAFSDRKGDPHSPNDGFWYAHAGWLFETRNVPLSIVLTFSGFGLQLRYLWNDLLRIAGKLPPTWRKMTRDLNQEPLMNALDTPLVIPALFAAQVAVAWLIGAWWGILWLWAMHVVQNNASWLINSVCHWSTFGIAADESRDGSRDVAAIGWLTNGDSFHNSHHNHPASAKHALNGGMDLSWWVICLLARLSLASEVKLPSGYAYPAWLARRQEAELSPP